MSETVKAEEAKGAECPFCKLDPERDPVLWRGGGVILLLSNPRLAPWHLLVVPERHVAHLWDLSKPERESLLDVAVGFQKRMMDVFSGSRDSPAGCDLVQHDRPFMPTDAVSVPGHLHLHLITRFWRDELYDKVSKYETGAFETLSREQAFAQADEWREALVDWVVDSR